MDPKEQNNSAVLRLSTPAASPFTLAGAPRERNGHPVRYFRKEVLPGRPLVHPKTGRRFHYPPEKMDQLIATFSRMSDAGGKVYVPKGHQMTFNPDNNYGWVKGLERDGNSLYAIMELVGEDAIKAAARNDVSVCISPWRDADGNDYEEALLHVALCPDPAIPGLKDFEPIAASSGRTVEAPVFVEAAANEENTMNKLTAEQLQKARKHVPEFPEEPTPEQWLALVDKLGTTATTTEGQLLASQSALENVTKERDTLKSDLQTKDNQILTLSRSSPDELIPPSIRSLVVKTHQDRMKALVPKLGKPVVDALSDLLIGKDAKSANVLMLSVSGDQGESMTEQLVDILEKVEPAPPLGEQDQPLALSRGLPANHQKPDAETAAVEAAVKKNHEQRAAKQAKQAT